MNEDLHELRAWLFEHCESYDEYWFFDALYDDLKEMFEYLDVMEPATWYGFVSPEWRIGDGGDDQKEE